MCTSVAGNVPKGKTVAQQRVCFDDARAFQVVRVAPHKLVPQTITSALHRHSLPALDESEICSKSLLVYLLLRASGEAIALRADYNDLPDFSDSFSTHAFLCGQQPFATEPPIRLLATATRTRARLRNERKRINGDPLIVRHSSM